MRVRDLRALFDELRGIFAASGAKPQLKTIDQVSGALAPNDNEPLDAYLENVRAKAQELAAPNEARFVQRLEDAALDEAAFQAVIAEIKADPNLKKADLQKIVEAYTGSFDRKANTAKLVDALKLTFYKRLYERNSRAMARRATPV